MTANRLVGSPATVLMMFIMIILVRSIIATCNCLRTVCQKRGIDIVASNSTVVGCSSSASHSQSVVIDRVV